MSVANYRGLEISVEANIGRRAMLGRSQNFESIHIGCDITRYAHESAPQQAVSACCHSAYALIERDKTKE